MRTPILAFLLPLAACGGGGEGGNAQGEGNRTAPAPRSTAPAPRTPVMQITPAPGNEATWMEPRPAPDAPQSAPYGNLLDQPVVKGAPAR
jgi:hypothetical protein